MEEEDKDIITSTKNKLDSSKIPTFEDLGLNPELCKACSLLGFKHPTAIQQAAIPYALKGKDIIGLAQTGSGKTGAFVLPILQGLLENTQPFYACCLAPVRELAVQIGAQFEALGSTIGVKVVVLVGGVDEMQQVIKLSKHPHIIVATPGRLVYHLEKTKGFHLKRLKTLVLDEADRLLHVNYEDELNQILSLLPKERSTYLYSATMTNKVRQIQRASLRDPVKVTVAQKCSTVDSLKQELLFIPAMHKLTYLVFLLNEFAGNSVIVFVGQCKLASKIALALRNLGFSALALHGKMDQVKRFGALTHFKAGGENIIIATDVASRGIDIPKVDLVINYDMPVKPKDYVHRVGRTARAERAGRALSLVSQYNVEQFQKIEKVIGVRMEKYPAAKEDVMRLKEVVAEAERIAEQKIREKGWKNRKRKNIPGKQKKYYKSKRRS